MSPQQSNKRKPSTEALPPATYYDEFLGVTSGEISNMTDGLSKIQSQTIKPKFDTDAAGNNVDKTVYIDLGTTELGTANVMDRMEGTTRKNFVTGDSDWLPTMNPDPLWPPTISSGHYQPGTSKFMSVQASGSGDAGPSPVIPQPLSMPPSPTVFNTISRNEASSSKIIEDVGSSTFLPALRNTGNSPSGLYAIVPPAILGTNSGQSSHMSYEESVEFQQGAAGEFSTASAVKEDPVTNATSHVSSKAAGKRPATSSTEIPELVPVHNQYNISIERDTLRVKNKETYELLDQIYKMTIGKQAARSMHDSQEMAKADSIARASGNATVMDVGTSPLRIQPYQGLSIPKSKKSRNLTNGLGSLSGSKVSSQELSNDEGTELVTLRHDLVQRLEHINELEKRVKDLEAKLKKTNLVDSDVHENRQELLDRRARLERDFETLQREQGQMQAQIQETVKPLVAEISENNATIQRLHEEAKQWAAHLEVQRDIVSIKNKHIERLKKQLEGSPADSALTAQQDEKIKNLEIALFNKDEKIRVMERIQDQGMKNFELAMIHKDEKMKAMEIRQVEKIKNLERELPKRDEVIKVSERNTLVKISGKDNTIKSLQSQISSIMGERYWDNTQILGLQGVVADLERKLTQSTPLIESLRSEIKDKDIALGRCSKHDMTRVAKIRDFEIMKDKLESKIMRIEAHAKEQYDRLKAQYIRHIITFKDESAKKNAEEMESATREYDVLKNTHILHIKAITEDFQKAQMENDSQWGKKIKSLEEEVEKKFVETVELGMDEIEEMENEISSLEAQIEDKNALIQELMRESTWEEDIMDGEHEEGDESEYEDLGEVRGEEQTAEVVKEEGECSEDDLDILDADDLTEAQNTLTLRMNDHSEGFYQY